MSNIDKFSRHAKAALFGAIISGCGVHFGADELSPEEKEKVLQVLEDEQMTRPVVQELIRSAEGIAPPGSFNPDVEEAAKSVDEMAHALQKKYLEGKIYAFNSDDLTGFADQGAEKNNRKAGFYSNLDGSIFLNRDKYWDPDLLMHEISHSEDGHSDAINDYVDQYGGTRINKTFAELTLEKRDFAYQMSMLYDLAEYPLNYRMKMLDSCLNPENMIVGEHSASCEVSGGSINPVQFYENLNNKTQEEWAEDQAFLALRDYGEVFNVFGIDEDELVNAYNNEKLHAYFQEYLGEWHKEMKEIYGEDFFEREDYGEGIEHDEIINKRWDGIDEMSDIDYQRPVTLNDNEEEDELKIENEPRRWGKMM